ncbi:MAG: DUF1015 domain-containing protein, partial [Candidatus Lokiarchaeota archaeon]|nr:DUF1015 domain-containing protein [Candidatus Lokiarchaeota archaeon]
PDGEGDEVYANAKKEMERLIDEEIILQDKESSIYIYRQESEEFGHEGIITGVDIRDYDEERIKIHEYTREKPLADRTAHVTATRMNTGLVWNAYKQNAAIQKLINKVKKTKPVFDFKAYGYRNILWKISQEKFIKKFQEAFAPVDIYIADGHHRIASAAAYHKKKAEQAETPYVENANWNYVMLYLASDHQVRILPYNRVIRELPMEATEFLKKLGETFSIEVVDGKFSPNQKHEIGMFLGNTWYKLTPKKLEFENFINGLDVSILQNHILDPILGIKDIRKSDNIFFVGGLARTESNEMSKYVIEKGNAIFFSLYPVSMKDIEIVADQKGVMPPKSTWFDPKLLTGLVFNPLF